MTTEVWTHAQVRLAGQLGIAGGSLGVASGIVQATVGPRLADWTGNKAAPGALGLLTVGLSLLAGLAAQRQRDPDLTVGARALCAVGLLVPGLLCFSTVGRLWYLPGPILLAAAALTVQDRRATARVIGQNWPPCLLGVLGATELLMAAGAAPLPMTVGAIGAAALLTAAVLAAPTRATLLGLLAVGTVPFAVIGWTALVPVLLLLVVAGLAPPLLRQAPARPA